MSVRCKMLFLVLCGLGMSAVWARPLLHPEVKEYAPLGGSFEAKELPVFYQDQCQCAIAADETQSKGGKSVWGGVSAAEKGVYVAVADSDNGKRLIADFKVDVPAKDQGYAIVAKDGRVAIVGHDSYGTLYGAVTYAQMARNGSVESACVRDWPDMRVRGGVSIGRGLFLLGNGDKDRRPAIKAGIDMMLRMKLNDLDDIFHIKPDAKDEDYPFWRELVRYAEDRGMMFRGEYFMSVYFSWAKPESVTLDTWPCVKVHRSWRDEYYCWCDDDLTRKAAERFANFIEKIGMKRSIPGLHPVDGGFWQDPELWSKRCAKCRALWKDDERWKASIRQLDIWTDVLKSRMPELTVYDDLYPYSFGMLSTPEKDRSDLFRQSMPEYWKKVHEGVKDGKLAFGAWIYPAFVIPELRTLMPGRELINCEPYVSSAGIFSTYHRRNPSVWEPNGLSSIEIRGSDAVDVPWESIGVYAEYAWDVHATGAEPYEGGTYYDPLTDHTGPKVIVESLLPRICRLFWGDELAPFMAEAVSSGVMPGYIKDPAYFEKYWNSIRRDPLFDPTQEEKAGLVAKHFDPIVDTPEMMGDQVVKAEKCRKALSAAMKHLDGLDLYKRRYFMRLAKLAPHWIAAARAQHVVRCINRLAMQGDNEKALELVACGRQEMMRDFDLAEANEKALEGEPHASLTIYGSRSWTFDRKKALEMLERAEASAKVVLKPRKIGREIKLGIVAGEGAKGVKEYFDGFRNVKAAIFDTIGLDELDKFDCVFFTAKPYTKGEYFANVKAYVERGGGGAFIEGELCGHKRFSTKTPFPEIVVTAPDRHDNYECDVTLSCGKREKTMYVDYFVLQPGKKGEVRAYGKDGVSPMAVRGQAGAGKVFFFGTFNVASVAGGHQGAEKKLFGANAALAKEAVEYFTGVRLMERKP